ncbi:MAG: hypothetical protein EOP84_35145 [Verrucomicrobiaceae bacterium]|nr:MAG: hypothetical protein EOP84_35145 [Verrucomicrobiaceae bacterium]
MTPIQSQDYLAYESAVLSCLSNTTVQEKPSLEPGKGLGTRDVDTFIETIKAMASMDFSHNSFPYFPGTIADYLVKISQTARGFEIFDLQPEAYNNYVLLNQDIVHLREKSSSAQRRIESFEAAAKTDRLGFYSEEQEAV